MWLHSVAQNAGGYYAGDEIVLIAEFDERVSVLGSPRLAIEVGEQLGHAVFSPWVEDDFPPERPSWRQRFVYEVAPEDMDQDGISVAADGFDFSSGALLDASGAEIAVEIYAVATARESPDPVGPGEALDSHRVTGTPEPRVCSDERERAIRFGNWHDESPILVHEWNGEPFRFYWDSSIPEDLKAYTESTFVLVERVSGAIEAQIGYSVLEVAGWVDEDERGFEFTGANVPVPCVGVRPGGIVATVHPREVHYGAGAMVRCGLVIWSAGALDEEGAYRAATHEIFHLFGFSHSPKVEGQSQSPPGEGVHMSESLSAGRPAIWPRPELAGLTWDDMDALRCIFPEPGALRIWSHGHRHGEKGEGRWPSVAGEHGVAMTKDQLVAKLKEMRKAGAADGRGRATAMGHLFGIIFDREIAASGANAAQIALEAGVPGDGGVRDGQNLAEYVNVTPAMEERWGSASRSGEESPLTDDELVQVMREEALGREGTWGEGEVAGAYPAGAVALITAAEDLLRVFLDVPPPRAGPDPVAAAAERRTPKSHRAAPGVGTGNRIVPACGPRSEVSHREREFTAEDTDPAHHLVRIRARDQSRSTDRRRTSHELAHEVPHVWRSCQMSISTCS